MKTITGTFLVLVFFFSSSGCETLIDTSARGEGTGVQIIGGITYAVRQYKKLSAQEAEAVRREAERVYEQRIAAEMKRQETRVEKEKRAVRQKAEKKVAVAETPARKEAVLADQKKELQGIEQDWRKSAVASVHDKYGSNFALPVKNPDGKAVVALVSLRDDKVMLASNYTYQLDTSPAELARVASAEKSVTLEGAARGEYAMLARTSVSVGAP